MALERILFDPDNGLSNNNLVFILNEYARGRFADVNALTVQLSAVANSTSGSNGNALTSDMIGDIQDITQAINLANKLPDKLAIIQEIKDVFVLSQSSNSGMYQTEEEIRARLGLRVQT